jgi:hypothetical protein
MGRIIGGGLPIVKFTDHQVFVGTAIAFNGTIAIGDPVSSGNRLVVVGIYTAGTTTTSVLLDGVASTRVITANDPDFWQRVIPTGTTCTIRVNQSILSTYIVNVLVWTISNLQSTTATASVKTTANPSPLSLNVGSRSATLGMATNVGSSSSFTWSGLTEDYQTSSVINNNPHTGAHLVSGSAATPLAISVSRSAPNIARGIAATWR